MGDKIKAVLQAFWLKLNTNLGELWQSSKWFVILFGIVILIIKFHTVLIDILISNANRIFSSATKTSDASQARENQDNQQANALIQDANSLPGQQKPIDENWNKK